MKKIDRLFKDFPELKLIEDWIRKALISKNKHPIKWIYKRYCLRKPKRFNEAMEILKNPHEDPFKGMWASMYVDFFYSGTALLDHLNICLSKLKNLKGINLMLKNLKNKEQFFDTISELEFNAYFSGRYVPELEPKISSIRLDSKITLGEREILVEIITPKLDKKLENSKKAVTLFNRSKGKILDKVDRQIFKIKDKIRSPLVLVVNGSYSDIDEYDLEDSVLGQLQITIIKDNKTGRIIDDYPSRAKNSIMEKKQESELISAVLFYRRNISILGKGFRRNLIINNRAKYPLTAKEYKKLMRFNLDKI